MIFERYLAGEPVEAGARRPVTGCASCAAAPRGHGDGVGLATMLVAATSVSTWLAVRATRSRSAGPNGSRRRGASVARVLPNQGAVRRAAAGPGRRLGHEVTLREAIDAAESASPPDLPPAQSRGFDPRYSGRTYVRLGEFRARPPDNTSECVALRGLKLGADHPDTWPQWITSPVAYRQAAAPRGRSHSRKRAGRSPGVSRSRPPPIRSPPSATWPLPTSTPERLAEAIPLLEQQGRAITKDARARSSIKRSSRRTTWPWPTSESGRVAMPSRFITGCLRFDRRS